ncbi:class I SAM-dependent methyltransferase [Amorphus sp. MBR-141]
MSDPSTSVCPICESTAFTRGPNGRLSPEGALPRCAGCRSLERHRAYRTAFVALDPARFSALEALQFSPDPVIEPGWFAHHEISEYGTATELDLQAIDRADASFDVVIVNHVLEHVPDDLAALRELDRVVRTAGFVFLSVPDPARVPATRHYGRAREDKHGHWRVYGPDIVARFAEALPHCFVVTLQPSDPVTGAPDTAYLITRSERVAADAARRLGTAGIAATRQAPAG